MPAPTFDELLAARKLLAPTPIWHTPIHTSRTLGELAGVDDLRLKLELFQVTGSFKPRGAYCSIASLAPAELARGVIAVSAGNHAQAVAYAAALAGTRSVVVTWSTASELKLGGRPRLRRRDATGWATRPSRPSRRCTRCATRAGSC